MENNNVMVELVMSFIALGFLTLMVSLMAIAIFKTVKEAKRRRMEALMADIYG